MNNRLYVGNLSPSTTAEMLRTQFATVGEVSDVSLMTERDNGRACGSAFVTMSTAEAAERATAQLSGAVLNGRPMRVNEASEAKDTGGASGSRAPKDKNALRITNQYRASMDRGMVYELRCDGIGFALEMAQSPSAGEWRVQARTTQSPQLVVNGDWAATRLDALRVVGQLWISKTTSLGLPKLDWDAVASALMAVRAV
jgi:RNA recognition motif-containing protein